MRSNRPYLLRALYDWIVDNDCTPYIAVNAHYPGVEVPQDFVTDGQIVLNIAPRAVSSFEMTKDHLQLSTRFSGMPIDIYLPIGAVMGIYTQENGQGMVFEPEDPEDKPPEPPKGPQAIAADRQKPSKKSSTKPSKGKTKPSLRVVK